MLGALLRTHRARKALWCQGRRWLVAGQPVHETHPELLQSGELAPGIHCDEFSNRRRNLARALPAGAVAIIPSSDPILRSGIQLPYRQSANFLYLTGITQQALAVIKSNDSKEPDYILFVPDPAESDRWDGETVDCEAAKHIFGAHEAYPFSQIDKKLPLLGRSASAVFMDWKPTEGKPGLVAKVRNALGETLITSPLDPYVQRLRVIKSAGEIRLMQLSAQIASRAMRRCLEITQKGISEHVLAAQFEYSCKVQGAQRLAYPSIVASGVDSCTIHYSRNDKEIQMGDLILMDAGCEVFGYVSDVTRTWPAAGQFSGAQKDLYEAVLSVHYRMLGDCKAGTSIKELHACSIMLLSEALLQLGITSVPKQSLTGGVYRQFYPHMIGHFLGLDVHDTGSLPKSLELVPGAVLALEPGLYIPKSPEFRHFQGLGIRIEDDVLVTTNKALVLSSEVPTDVDAIESLVQTSCHREDVLSTFGN